MYVDYEYYQTEYGGELVEELDFDRYELRASILLHEVALPQKIARALTQIILKDRIKMLLCELIDSLKEYDDLKATASTLDTVALQGITSETVKDHSVSYADTQTLGSSRLNALYKEKHTALIQDKLRMTGLLNRGL